MSKTKIAITVTACMFLFGCEFFTGNRVVFDSAAFDRARAAWKAQGITCYTFEVDDFRGGAPMSPLYRVIVRNGKIADVELLYKDQWSEEMNTEFISDILERGFTDIPAVFDWIQAVYDGVRGRNIERGSSFHINVTYNADYHFPESVNTSWRTRRPLNGGWSYIIISNFQPIEN